LMREGFSPFSDHHYAEDVMVSFDIPSKPSC
jgi:hypothetical protein